MIDDQTAMFALVALIWVTWLLGRVARGVETIGAELARLRTLAERGRQ